MGWSILDAGFTPNLVRIARRFTLDSSYFLDLEFWQDLLRVHPEGLVVGVPKRGGLLFVPASDIAAVNNFRRGIAPLFMTSENMRVSSALYLFKDTGWSVFQDPQPTQ
jgi:hypothetical protein